MTARRSRRTVRPAAGGLPPRAAKVRAGCGLAVALAATLALVVLLTLAPGARTQNTPQGELMIEPVRGLPATPVTLLGAAPAGAGGEVWATAPGGRLLRRTDADGWALAPSPAPATTVADLTFLDTSYADGRATGTRGSGSMSARGAGAALVQASVDGGELLPHVVLRDPGADFRLLPDPAADDPDDPADDADALLRAGEALARPRLDGPSATAPARFALTAIEEQDGRAGALLAPQRDDPATVVDGILHFDGERWTREPIEPPSGQSTLGARFEPIALDATGRDNAWLLAQADPAAGLGIVLYRRVLGDDGLTTEADDPADAAAATTPARWVHVPLPAGSPFAQAAGGRPGLTGVVAQRYPADPLTVTDAGLWVDGAATVGRATQQFTLYLDRAEQRVTGSWCDLADTAGAPLCDHPLGHALTADGSGFAGASSTAFSGPGYGSRVVVRGGEAGALLFDGAGAITQLLGKPGADASSAMLAPDSGWIGGDPAMQLSRAVAARSLQSYPVPVRRPLLGAAGEPGKPVGALDAQALAVGVDGTIVRYLPGEGWRPEFALEDSGGRARPTLRAVAWPERRFAVAVGDDGELWNWTGNADGRWIRDESRPDELAAHLQDVAFQPGRGSDLGFAVGREGTLLRFGKTWTQEPLPAGWENADLLAVDFAGGQALVVAQKRDGGGGAPASAVLISAGDAAGWRVDEGLTTLLADHPGAYLTTVAGLPDGGAVVAGSGFVAYRDTLDGAWRLADRPLTGVIAVAASAFRDGDRVRSVLSVTPPVRISVWPMPLAPESTAPASDSEPAPRRQRLRPPEAGTLMRDSAQGWRDEQREQSRLEARPREGLYPESDVVAAPDPIAALLLDERGEGWAVGGESSGTPDVASRQTASVYRYPGGAPLPAVGSYDIALDPGKITFAVGGGAGCANPCAARDGRGLAGDVLLERALEMAAGLAQRPEGPRAFLYTGQFFERHRDLFSGYDPALTGSLNLFSAPEASRFAAIAGARNEQLPFYAAFSDGERVGEDDRSADLWKSVFGAFPRPFGSALAPDWISTAGIPGRPAADGARTHYAFDVQSTAGSVRVIVLDTSKGSLAAAEIHQNPPGEPQEQWVLDVIAAARAEGIPSIVVTSDALTRPPASAGLPAGAVPGFAGLQGLAARLRDAGASAHFFELHQQNRSLRIPEGESDTIPSFGTGTLNGGSDPRVQRPIRYDQSGFLLAEVDVSRVDPASGRAPVTTRLIPVISELSLEAVDGVSLRRSRPALFAALARKPQIGLFAHQDPYVPLPPADPCPQSDGCATAVTPEYEFVSSDPDIGTFVARDPNASDPRAVLLDGDGKPVADGRSGLFCPFNAGTTTVTVRAGGLSYATRVTVSGGAIARPCGTMPLSAARFSTPPAIVRVAEPGAASPSTPQQPQQPSPPSVPEIAVPALAPAALPTLPPTAPPPVPPVVAPLPAAAPPAPPPAAGVPAPPPSPTPVRAIAPPATPPGGRPAPPSGSAPVQQAQFSNAPAVKRAEEEEHAVQESFNFAARRDETRGGGVPNALVFALLLAAAGGGATAARHWGRGGVTPVPVQVQVRSRR